jgi:hypothetical protein
MKKMLEGRSLMTMQEICEYTKRNERTIKKQIARDNFPAIKIDGRWTSHTTLIDRHFMAQVEKQVYGRA